MVPHFRNFQRAANAGTTYMSQSCQYGDSFQAKHFEPEVVRQMSLALETICWKFGMKLIEDPATRVVALKIIELAQRGVHDAPTLTELTLKELKHCLPYAPFPSANAD